jgi:hypothetical protein
MISLSFQPAIEKARLATLVNTHVSLCIDVDAEKEFRVGWRSRTPAVPS